MTLGALIPCGGGDTISLTREKLLIGRRPQCDICLRFKSISSQHCELELRDGYWHIRDLGSSNGTKVNGLRVEEKCLLPGDEVTLARQVFNIDYSIDDNSGAEEEEEQNLITESLMQKAGLEGGKGPRKPKSVKRSTSTGHCSPRDQFLMEWLSDE